MTKSHFEDKLITLIKPKEMSIAEYKLKCMINGIVASADDPMFMSWAINEAYSDFKDEIHEKARALIVQGLKCHCILDFTKDVDCSYICEIIPEIVLHEPFCKAETEELFRVILEEYKGTKLWEAAYHLNKGLGITSTCYFE